MHPAGRAESGCGRVRWTGRGLWTINPGGFCRLASEEVPMRKRSASFGTLGFVTAAVLFGACGGGRGGTGTAGTTGGAGTTDGAGTTGAAGPTGTAGNVG